MLKFRMSENEAPPPKAARLGQQLSTKFKSGANFNSCYAAMTSLCGALVFLLIGLVGFGAAIQAFEADEEIKVNEEFQALIVKLRALLVEEEDLELIAELAKRDLVEGLQGFSTFDSENGNWRGNEVKAFFSSIAYAFDLSSTIGYGEIPARTTGGRAVSIVAILLLFPLTVLAYTRLSELVYNTIGNRLMSNNKHFKAVIKRYDKELNGELDVEELSNIFNDLGLKMTNQQMKQVLEQYDFSHNSHLDENEFRQLCVDLNIKVGLLARENFELEVAFGLFFIYVVIFTLITFFTFLNDSFFDSFYFVVITLTTVGLGDVVPPQELRAVFSVLAFVGVGFMALLFKALSNQLYAKTDLKRHYFHRALEPVFQRGRIVSLKTINEIEDEGEVEVKEEN